MSCQAYVDAQAWAQFCVTTMESAGDGVMFALHLGTLGASLEDVTLMAYTRAKLAVGAARELGLYREDSDPL